MKIVYMNIKLISLMEAVRREMQRLQPEEEKVKETGGAKILSFKKSPSANGELNNN